MTRQERKMKGQSDPPAQKQKSSTKYRQIESNNFVLKKTIHHNDVGLGLSQECRVGSTLENEIKMSCPRRKGTRDSVIQWGHVQQ